MSNETTVLWGIHAGSSGEADEVFRGRNRVAIGWHEMGDLGSLSKDREKIKARFVATYPSEKPGAVPGKAGQLLRFVHEMKPGDAVVYYSHVSKLVHIGVIDGSYEHRPDINPVYPNTRKVKWTTERPRTAFSQGALHEIGSAMALFQVKNYASEFFAAMEGVDIVVPVVDDETVALVAAEIEQTTRDFVIKRLAQELKGHPFSHLVAQLLQAMGYRTRVSEPGPDAGVDIVAHKDELGFEPPIIKVQVKSSEGSVGAPEVQALYGTVGNDEYGLLVTLGTFTTAAKNFDRGKSNLRLIDGEELVSLTLQHYEQLDSKYKGLIPLRRVYIPESTEEATA